MLALGWALAYAVVPAGPHGVADRTLVPCIWWFRLDPLGVAMGTRARRAAAIPEGAAIPMGGGDAIGDATAMDSRPPPPGARPPSRHFNDHTRRPATPPSAARRPGPAATVRTTGPARRCGPATPRRLGTPSGARWRPRWPTRCRACPTGPRTSAAFSAPRTAAGVRAPGHSAWVSAHPESVPRSCVCVCARSGHAPPISPRVRVWSSLAQHAASSLSSCFRHALLSAGMPHAHATACRANDDRQWPVDCVGSGSSGVRGCFSGVDEGLLQEWGAWWPLGAPGPHRRLLRFVFHRMQRISAAALRGWDSARAPLRCAPAEFCLPPGSCEGPQVVGW